MSAHGDVVTALEKILTPRGGELRLLGRVAHPGLGNTSRKEVYFFIPDLHLLSPERQEVFGNYRFNHEKSRLLVRVLKVMERLKRRWAPKRKLVTIQLGDFFDLWREFSGNVDLNLIGDAHAELRNLLYRGQFRGRRCLKATMLFGNHDTRRGVALREIDFRLRAYNRSPRPFLFTTHGDCFDQFEVLTSGSFASSIKEFVVRFLKDLTPVNTYGLDVWGKAAAKGNKPLSQLTDSIVAPRHDLTCPEGAVKVTSGKPLPKVLARAVKRPGGTRTKRFQDYWRAFRQAGKDYPEELGGVRVAVVGHSHEAGMLWHEPRDGAPGLLLMDVGGWIERCRYALDDGDEVADEPSAQLAVIHKNDARLYQLRYPGA